ncbi:MAG TPA: phage major capsid protein [Verrucomicrobiae bacterium]
MSKKSFIDTFTGLTAPSVKQAADNLESARRGQSEAGLYRASALMRLAMARERRVSVHEMADQILADGLIREYLDVLPRFVCGVGCHGKNYDLVRKSLTPGAGLGGGLLPIDVSKSIFDLVGINGVYRHLGVVEMTSMETKIGQATANSAAIWITPTSMGAAIPADTSLTGTSLTPEANTIAILLRVSRELLQDEKANLSFYLLTRFAEGIAAAFDFASLQGTGANDQVSGSQTGIWNDNTIATATAAQGNNAIGQLARADFLAAVAAVSPAALQRECKWFISSSFIAPLMALVDTQGREYLLKTPAETGDGTWRLVGFEVVWAAQAPAVNQPGSIIAAFGHGPSYQVGIRTELEVMLRDSTSGFQSNEQSFRALGRGFCQTRAASGLAKLALAPA